MTEPECAPTLSEFLALVRDEFSFLSDFGFVEVRAPAHRASEKFQVWFSAGDRSVVVRGSGYGLMVDVTLETPEFWLYDQRLTVTEPPRRRRARREPTSQSEEIHKAARRVRGGAADFLNGDLTRFQQRAEPLPEYLRP